MHLEDLAGFSVLRRYKYRMVAQNQESHGQYNLHILEGQPNTEGEHCSRHMPQTEIAYTYLWLLTNSRPQR